MKSKPLFAHFLASTTLASPILTRQEPSDVLIPEFWTFDLLSWNGPGCPDYPKYNGTETDNSFTRQSIGPYLFNSSADTWWFYFAYPWMRVRLSDISGHAAKSNNTWCESTIKYQEMANDYGTRRKEEESKYRLRMHKNGTTIEAVYKLRDGMSAEWKVTYLAENGDEVLASDYAKFQGPRTTQDPNKNDFDFLTPDTKPQFKSAQCASSIFRVKMELRLISAGMRGEGSVESKKIDWNNGKGPIWDGANLGLSYDWESCKS